MKQNRFPQGWDESRVKAVITHYEQQTEEEEIQEDEKAFGDGQAVVSVPHELMSEVRKLLAKHGK